MLKNYWIIAWRSLNKQRFYSLLNIIGLSIGLASCLIIFCYVTDELGYDQFVTDPENTYRIDADIKFGADEVYNATVPAPLAEVLQEAFPQVLTTTRLYKPQHSALVRRKGDANNQMETNLLF